RNRASGLSPSSARRLGLPGPDQAHPEAQIQLPRTPALLLQRRLPGPRARPANLLPPRLRRILLRRAKADGGERPEDLWGSALRGATLQTEARAHTPQAARRAFVAALNR